MTTIFGAAGAPRPLLGAVGERLLLRAARPLGEALGLAAPAGAYAIARGQALAERVRGGAPVYLLGLTAASHGASAALVEVGRERGLSVLHNDEEERFSGKKHDDRYPAGAVAALLDSMKARGLRPDDLHACVSGWDFGALLAHLGGTFLGDLPGSLAALSGPALEVTPLPRFAEVASVSERLARQLGRRMPLVGMRHHDNHASFAYGASPFARGDEPVLVTVIDGAGDDGPVSLYLAQAGRLRLLSRTPGVYDSLGALYAMLSSTQGGWPPLSSEGRYMGAAAWGDGDRLTNPYYRRLREILHLGPEGRVAVNRALVRFYRVGRPSLYAPALAEILGPPIPHEKLWNPDAILSLDDVRHAPVTRERLDKAAAAQMVFEDALFHVVDHLIRSTRASRLVMAGGTALNCVASMRLLARYDERFYERNLGAKGARLHLWVPPTPGDSGVAMGAAYNFAMTHGVRPRAPLPDAFLCGEPYESAAIVAALREGREDGHLPLGDAASPAGRASLADLLAFLVAGGAVIGLFQGRAETGPRALGHRSILADPRDPGTLAKLNQRVKLREPFRPLAPMCTRAAAEALFELSPGASDDDHDAYRYMVLTAPARPAARARVPAVVHEDGTARLQIVDERDPFTHAYLVAMGRRAGVEVSVNTSLNVGSPIVQTPAQALAALHRSRGMDGILFIAAGGEAHLAWHASTAGAKDGGRRLRALVHAWQRETGAAIALPAG